MNTQEVNIMVYKRGRFVIYYKDGLTYIEDRNDPNSWNKRPKKPFAALGIQPDNNLLVTIKDKLTGKRSQVSMTLDERINLEPIVLKGSFKYDYGFFMLKESDKKFIGGAPRDVWGIVIGMVVDNLGHCVCTEYVGSGMPRTYYTTVHSIHMDANSRENNFGIYLEKLPDPTAEMPTYPENNPLKREGSSFSRTPLKELLDESAV